MRKETKNKFLISQAPYRHNIYAVLRTLVGIFTDTSQHHFERWGLHLIGIDFTFQCHQVSCALLYELVATQLHLNQSSVKYLVSEVRIADLLLIFGFQAVESSITNIFFKALI